MTPPLQVLLPNGEVLAVLVYIDDPIQGIIPWDGSSGGGGGSDVNLVSVGGSPVALGNTDAADSIPVTIAQDIPVLVGGLFLGTSVLPINVDGGGSLFVTPQTLPPNAATENGTLAFIQSNTFPLTAEAGVTQVAPTGPMVQGIANTIPVSYANGQNAPLSLDLNSNLRVITESGSSIAAAWSNVTGTLTNNGDTVILDITGMAQVTVVLRSTTGGYNGAAAFQVSNDGGTTWVSGYAIQAYDTWGRTYTFLPSDGGNLGWVVPVAGFNKFRLLAANITVGTGTYVIAASATPWAYPRMTVGLIGGGADTAAVDGSGNVSVRLPNGVAGPTASGSAKSGNPVQTGAVYNSLQPTVSTGQVVESQATSRGAQIVATGVDGFAVTGSVNATNDGSFAKESGGFLDRQYALQATLLRLQVQQLRLTPPSNGFIPLEIPSFLGI